MFEWCTDRVTATGCTFSSSVCLCLCICVCVCHLINLDPKGWFFALEAVATGKKGKGKTVATPVWETCFPSFATDGPLLCWYTWGLALPAANTEKHLCSFCSSPHADKIRLHGNRLIHRFSHTFLRILWSATVKLKSYAQPISSQYRAHARRHGKETQQDTDNEQKKHLWHYPCCLSPIPKGAPLTDHMQKIKRSSRTVCTWGAEGHPNTLT